MMREWIEPPDVEPVCPRHGCALYPTRPIIPCPECEIEAEEEDELSKTIRYVECAHCGETVGTYYVTCPYCGYKLAARKSTGMDPLYGMTDDGFYKRFGSM